MKEIENNNDWPTVDKVRKRYTIQQAEKIISRFLQNMDLNEVFQNKNKNIVYTLDDVEEVVQVLENDIINQLSSKSIDIKKIILKKLRIYDIRTRLADKTDRKMKWQKMFLDTVELLHRLDKDIAKHNNTQKKNNQIQQILDEIRKRG